MYEGWLKHDFITEIEKLKDMICIEQKKIKTLRYIINNQDTYIQKLITEPNNQPQVKIHNERGAGRKPKITEDIDKKINQYRNQGMSYKSIASTLSLSVSTVHRVANRKGL